MTAPLVVTVIGDPETQGSKTIGTTRDGRAFVREDNKRLKPWRRRVTKVAAAEFAMQRQLLAGGPLEGPIDVDVWSYIRRPRGHYGSGRNAARLLPSAPDFPIAAQTGDVDKFARACLDALTQAGVIADDVRVVDLHTYKRYADMRQPGAVLIVRRHEAAPETVQTVATQGALL